jgi:hypothetical protein
MRSGNQCYKNPVCCYVPNTGKCSLLNCGRKYFQKKTDKTYSSPITTKQIFARAIPKYDREFNASAVKLYNATSSLVRFVNKNISFYYKKRCSLLPTMLLL